MSYHNRWCTKDDILKDLAEVTGRVADVDDMFIVTDGKPPPRLGFDEEDEEMNLRFQQNIFSGDQVTPEPDLKGITQMLRMVNEIDEPENDCDVPATEQVVVSKLNPNVPEFVPTDATSSHKKKFNSDSKVVNKTDISKNNPICIDKPKRNDFNNVNDAISDGVKETYEKPKVNGTIESSNNIKSNEVSNNNESTQEKRENSNIEIDMNKRIDLSELNCDQIKNMTKKLRSKISDATKKEGSKFKRERNVAIATLLKLYSATPPTTSPALDGLSKSSSSTSSNQATPVSTESGSSTPSKIICKPSPVTLSISHDPPETLSESTRVIPDANKYATDPAIQNSIKKVNNWFVKPSSPTPKGLTVCLGPISFKKKTSAPAKSPASEVSSRSTPTNNVVPQTTKYRPSQYAEDLSKKFEKRGKVLEAQNLDIWERLQIQMKEKEELMKKKSQKQSSDDQSEENDYEDS